MDQNLTPFFDTILEDAEDSRKNLESIGVHDDGAARLFSIILV